MILSRPFLKDRISIVLIILGSFQILLFSLNHVNAQCQYSAVIAQDYFRGECGVYHSQSLLQVHIPVYGTYGDFSFTSPLTNDVKITGTQDFNAVIEVYPNPTLGYLNINWPLATDADIFIFSQIGNLISSSRVSANTVSTIDVQHLLPGYYIIKAVTLGNQTFISKLIKQ